MNSLIPDITEKDIDRCASGKGETCKLCGAKDLVWKKNSIGQWRLARVTGHWHYCKQYHTPITDKERGNEA